MCYFPYLPRFAAECRILEVGVHLCPSGRNVNVHIRNENTQFAVFCIFPATKEKAVTLIVSPPNNHDVHGRGILIPQSQRFSSEPLDISED